MENEELLGEPTEQEKAARNDLMSQLSRLFYGMRTEE